jgi:hypothetical protein
MERWKQQLGALGMALGWNAYIFLLLLIGMAAIVVIEVGGPCWLLVVPLAALATIQQRIVRWYTQRMALLIALWLVLRESLPAAEPGSHQD